MAWVGSANRSKGQEAASKSEPGLVPWSQKKCIRPCSSHSSGKSFCSGWAKKRRGSLQVRPRSSVWRNRPASVPSRVQPSANRSPSTVQRPSTSGKVTVHSTVAWLPVTTGRVCSTKPGPHCCGPRAAPASRRCRDPAAGGSGGARSSRVPATIARARLPRRRRPAGGRLCGRDWPRSRSGRDRDLPGEPPEVARQAGPLTRPTPE